MALEIRPLMSSFAVVAGTKIDVNLSAFEKTSKLPKDFNPIVESWRAAQERLVKIRATAGTDLKVVDGAIDRCVAGIPDVCSAIVKCFDLSPIPLSAASQKRMSDAITVLDVFPEDMREITSLRYTLEWEAIGSLLDVLSSSPTHDAVVRLGLEAEVEHLRALHEIYGDTLGITTAKSSDESKLLQAWNTAYQTLLIAATYLDAQCPGLADAVNLPHEEQVTAQFNLLAEERRRVRDRRKKAEPPANS